jgi:glycerophosphoryl diester phosphodiesterase
MREQCDTEFFDLPRPRVIAHRGASGDYPENTLPAFKAASEAGAPYLELDVHLTHDGEVVVCHDDTLTRTAGQDGVIREMTFEKIRHADAGYGFSSSQAGNFPFRGQGIQIPMLREVLTAFSQHRFIVELKHGGELVRATVEIVRQAQMSRRVLIASEHQEPIEQIRTIAPDLPTNMPTQETGLFMMSLAPDAPDYVPLGDALQVPPEYHSWKLVTPESVKAAHKAGIEVHVWTVDDPVEMRALLAIGVDGILTNYPRRLIEAVRAG